MQIIIDLKSASRARPPDLEESHRSRSSNLAIHCCRQQGHFDTPASLWLPASWDMLAETQDRGIREQAAFRRWLRRSGSCDPNKVDDGQLLAWQQTKSFGDRSMDFFFFEFIENSVLPAARSQSPTLFCRLLRRKIRPRPSLLRRRLFDTASQPVRVTAGNEPTG